MQSASPSLSLRAALMRGVTDCFMPSACAAGGAAPRAAWARAATSTTSPSGPDGAEQASTSGGGPAAPHWDWKWVLGKAVGRKPAIKHPSRHQWLYCNPDYDPSAPLPLVLRSPYAPPETAHRTDWDAYRRELRRQPANREDVKRYRRSFTRFLALRELDWREAFQRGVAEDVRVQRKQERLAAEARRQAAWRQYRDAMFERARLEAAAGETGAAAPGSIGSTKG